MDKLHAEKAPDKIPTTALKENDQQVFMCSDESSLSKPLNSLDKIEAITQKSFKDSAE